MTSMATTAVFVTGGVDTHSPTHQAAVLDYMGRQPRDREFPTSPAGDPALLQWMSGHGVLDRVGVEGDWHLRGRPRTAPAGSRSAGGGGGPTRSAGPASARKIRSAGC